MMCHDEVGNGISHSPHSDTSTQYSIYSYSELLLDNGVPCYNSV